MLIIGLERVKLQLQQKKNPKLINWAVKRIVTLKECSYNIAFLAFSCVIPAITIFSNFIDILIVVNLFLMKKTYSPTYKLNSWWFYKYWHGTTHFVRYSGDPF